MSQKEEFSKFPDRQFELFLKSKTGPAIIYFPGMMGGGKSLTELRKYLQDNFPQSLVLSSASTFEGVKLGGPKNRFHILASRDS
ncbi:MAG: hypothetical protein NZL96_02795 [Patescibacteria group bacterium]|nr:hypothetical protein [Patescibacteria group bacterium]